MERAIPTGKRTRSPSTSAPAPLSSRIASGSPRNSRPTSWRITSALCSMSESPSSLSTSNGAMVRVRNGTAATAEWARAAWRAARPPPRRPWSSSVIGSPPGPPRGLDGGVAHFARPGRRVRPPAVPAGPPRGRGRGRGRCGAGWPVRPRAESDGDFFPRELFGPRCQKLHVRFRQRVFPVGPWHSFDLHTTRLAVDSPQSVGEKDCNIPKRHELKHPWLKCVVTGALPTTAGANRFTVGTGRDLDKKHQVFFGIQPDNIFVHKRLELLDPIQNSLELHPQPSLPFLDFCLPKLSNTGLGPGCATSFYLVALLALSVVGVSKIFSKEGAQ